MIMNKEEIIEDFITYLNQDIQSKDFLTYREQDEWKDYINRIINSQVKEKDKEIERLNNIINELKDDSRVLKEFSAWIVNRHEPDLFHKMEIVNKLSKLKEGK